MFPRVRVSRVFPVVLAVATAAAATAVAAGPSNAPRSAGATRAAIAEPIAATVRVTRRDIYQTLRLDGLVEARDPVPVRAVSAGQFEIVHGLVAGAHITRGATIATVRACDTAAVQSGDVAAVSNQGCIGRRTVVKSPTDGTLRLDRTSGTVAAGDELARIEPPGFRARLAVPDASDLYAFVAPPKIGKAEVVGGPSGFTVDYERTAFDHASGRVDVLVSLPLRLRLFEGLHIVVVFVTGRKDRALTLPRTAVRGERTQGQVVVVAADGTHQVRDVRLGVSDSEVVEVAGIAPGAAVLEFPLESDFGP